MSASELFSVEDQVVLVSGGSRGIGKELALGFVRHGAQVIATGRNPSTLAALSEETSQSGGRLRTIVCDVSDPKQIATTVEDVLSQEGRIDTLLNVAGVNKRQPTLDFSEADYDFVLDINLKGAFLMAQACGRHMVSRGAGNIINIDSLNSHGTMKNVTPYAMSKCGLHGMTKALALEWGPCGVRVNGLAPGFILTDLTQRLWADPEMANWGKTNTPLGRLGRPQDLVGTAIFLASPAAAFLTGQTIYVDGGFTCGYNWPIPADGGQSD